MSHPLPSVLAAITEMVRPSLVVNDSPLTLKETQKDADGQRFQLSRRGKTVIVDLDRARSVKIKGKTYTMSLQDRLFPLLEPTTSGCAVSCDYLIFHESEAQGAGRPGILTVILVELKAGSPHGACRQIENTRHLAEQIVHQARLRAKVGQTLQVRYRGVVVSGSAPSPRGRHCPGESLPWRESVDMPDLQHLVVSSSRDWHLEEWLR